MRLPVPVLHWPCRTVLGAAALLVLCGCPNPNAYTVPRTLDPADLQILVAAEAYGFDNRVATPTGSMRTFGATPLFPTLGFRYGIRDGLDFSVRLENFETLAGDVKWNFQRGRIFDMAFDPGIQAMYEVTTNANAGVFYFHAPLLLGFNVTEITELVVSPGLAYSVSTNSLGSGNTAETSGRANEFFARLGVGVDIRTGRQLALHPELTCMRGLGWSQSLLCVVGFGLNVGAQPNYSDVTGEDAQSQ